MQLINVTEMADKLKTTSGTIYAWVSSRKIPAWCIIKQSRSLKFDIEAVDRWLNSKRLAPLPSN